MYSVTGWVEPCVMSLCLTGKWWITTHLFWCVCVFFFYRSYFMQAYDVWHLAIMARAVFLLDFLLTVKITRSRHFYVMLFSFFHSCECDLVKMTEREGDGRNSAEWTPKVCYCSLLVCLPKHCFPLGSVHIHAALCSVPFLPVHLQS